MLCCWETTSQAAAGLMDMTHALTPSLLVIIPRDARGWRAGCPQKRTFPSAGH